MAPPCRRLPMAGLRDLPSHLLLDLLPPEPTAMVFAASCCPAGPPATALAAAPCGARSRLQLSRHARTLRAVPARHLLQPRPRASRRHAASAAAAAPVQAVLGSAGLLVAGAALGGILLGLLIAKAASDFFNRKEFAQKKALSENAILRAKASGRAGYTSADKAVAVCMRAGQVCARWASPARGERLTTASPSMPQVDELQQMVMVSTQLAHSPASGVDPVDNMQPQLACSICAAAVASRALPHMTPQLHVLPASQRYEPLAYKSMRLRFTKASTCTCSLVLPLPGQGGRPAAQHMAGWLPGMALQRNPT